METTDLDTTPVGVKIPRWLKQFAATIGEMSHEDIGEVLVRHAGKSISQEFCQRTTAVVAQIDGTNAQGGE